MVRPLRVYKDFAQARNEIERDLAELGKRVYAGYQSLTIDDDTQREALTTMELTNYDYRVLRPALEDLDFPNPDWFEHEWEERLEGIFGRPQNPGEAYKLRPEVWDPLLEHDEAIHGFHGVPKFSYTYSERLAQGLQVQAALQALVQNPASRQVYISIWDPTVDSARLGQRRVPCTLGYQITIRDSGDRRQVNLAYHMRSNDLQTHWANDVGFAVMLQRWFVEQLGLYADSPNFPIHGTIEMGHLTHMVGSLHVYAEQVAHVF